MAAPTIIASVTKEQVSVRAACMVPVLQQRLGHTETPHFAVFVAIRCLQTLRARAAHACARTARGLLLGRSEATR